MMSTFQGLIAEFPGISVDKFTDSNWNSSIFFLSHVHSDHIDGLSDFDFQDHLRETNRIVYSHEVSTIILRKKFPREPQQFQYLPLHVPTTMQTSDGAQFTITLLLAGHCPGSVMFLFENDRCRILYTGDFRLNIAEFKKFKGLYTPQGELKHINKIYLDTTFMLKRYEKFPSREESLQSLIKLITEWLELGENHEIDLETGYYYGGEYLLEKIYETFQMPVHVGRDAYECYQYFPNMDKCVTKSGVARIHLHCAGFRRCCSRPEAKIKTIMCSAWAWRDWNDGKDVQEEEWKRARVCYSTHASLQEIRDFLAFLNPEDVEANVEHRERDGSVSVDMTETLSLIDECIQGNSPMKRSPMKQIGFDNLYNLNSDDKTRLSKRDRKVETESDSDEEVRRLRFIRKKMVNSQNCKVKRDLGFDFDLSE